MSDVKPLVVLDCDSTAIQQEVIELLADFAGTRQQVERITAAAMRGEYDFSQSLNARVQTLAGVSTEVFAQVASAVTFSPGFSELVAATHRAHGKICVVSGGFLEILDLILPEQRVDRWYANRLEVREGKLTGRIQGEIVTAQTKADYLHKWAAEFGIKQAHTIAVGDGANDIQMLQAAAIGVGFNPKPIVRQAADVAVTDTLSPITELFQRL